MGDHESSHSTIAYYRQPAADGSRPGSYYINTTLPETRPRYEAEALAFHEAVPGPPPPARDRPGADDLPAFRRFGGPTAFVEGWGLYTRAPGRRDGPLLRATLDRFGILSFDAWRACRLVVDTGMHALGWSREQAIDFMLDHTALGREQHRQRGRPLHRVARARRSRTRSASARSSRSAATAEDAPRAARSTSGRSTTPSLGEGAVGLRTLRGVIEAWIARTSG